MPTSTGSHSPYTLETQEALDRYGFTDPYDPRFIYRSVFGAKMRGRAQTWPDIDLDVLREVNHDVVGWIHMDGTPLDYPVVRDHLDHSFYLTHNFSGEESFHGQISLDFRHGGSFDGRTVLLRGHSMKDWSMMHVLIEMDEQSYFDDHPTVQVLHEGGMFSARWFAGTFFYDQDPWPATVSFPDNAAFESWLSRINRENRLKSDITPTVHDRVLVCFTCTPEPKSVETNRYALFAVIE